ncbi:hypothetical protein [Fluviicola sp.]|uniref:hypothetical protein n=1 Tax=Fluviicola sp. TaxID=1917219 RepID=UPI0031CE908B
MKYLLFIFCFTGCFFLTYSQTSGFELEKYRSDYEREVLLNKHATHLEMLMALGDDASAEKTLAVKKQLDEFVNEVKSSGMMRMSEAKLMKELHKKIHERFLRRYKYVSPFNEIFKTGQYNCVSGTALFALVLEELDIPYNIQEMPTHVYIMAYPDTKAISVEMTALKDASYIPARKDVSKAVRTLVEFGLSTPEKIRQQGELQVYNAFFNTNSVVNLKQLAGIQYYNEAIVAVNENQLLLAFEQISKAEKWYDVDKARLLKAELLVTLMADADFSSMDDIGYLVGYANIKKADQTKVYYQYAKFLNAQLLTKGNKALADSSYTYIEAHLQDTATLKRMGALYYFCVSDYYSNAYNLKKQLEYAELSYNTSVETPGIQLWLVRCIMLSISKTNEDEEEILAKLDAYADKYPFLRKHNLYLVGYFYAYAELSNKFYVDNDGTKGKKYFDLAVQAMNDMEDKEVLDQDNIGWLYAEAGAYLYRENDYKAALKILEEGLKLAPGHERIVARIEIVKTKLK